METLYSALGQFYFTTHTNKPPTFLQVVGWTKGAEKPETKRQYVYVRKVPLATHHTLDGGVWEFDQKTIKNYSQEIATPIRKSSAGIDTAILIPGAHFLRYQSITVPIKTFDYAPVSITGPVETIDADELLEHFNRENSQHENNYTRLHNL